MGVQGNIWDLRGAEREGGSSRLGSCCVLGRGLAWGRAGQREEDSSAWRSFCRLRLGLGDVEEPGGERGLLDLSGGCWAEEVLQGDEEDKRCIEYRLLLAFSSLLLRCGPAGSWGDISLPSPPAPFCCSPEGISAQSLAALNAPCVVCADQMLHPRSLPDRHGRAALGQLSCNPAAGTRDHPEGLTR